MATMKINDSEVEKLPENSKEQSQKCSREYKKIHKTLEKIHGECRKELNEVRRM